MDNDKDFEHRLTVVEDMVKANIHRLADIEKRQNDLNDLVSTVKVLAVREENVEADVKEIKKDVKELTGKAGKRWDAIVEKVLLTAVGAILLFILAKLGF